MKKILIIQGHPREQSFCRALEESYSTGCGKTANVECLHLRDITFDLVLKERDGNAQPLEPDLIEAQKKIKECNHLVIIYPTWWGSVPALLKGFFDRIFLPGFAFSYRSDSTGWDKLLSDKTARIVTTMDAPSWYNRFVYCRSSIKQVEKATLGFCGIKTIKYHIYALVRKSTPQIREKWLNELREAGEKDAG